MFAYLFHAIMTVVLIAMVWVQLNDPDPALWVAVYGYLTIACIIAAISKIRWFYLIMALVIIVLLMIPLFSGVIDWITVSDETILQGMDRSKPYLEETREFFGLLIGLIVIVVNMIHRKKRDEN